MDVQAGAVWITDVRTFEYLIIYLFIIILILLDYSYEVHSMNREKHSQIFSDMFQIGLIATWIHIGLFL